LYLLLAVACAFALGLWTASLTVQFCDLRLVVQYGMQIAMYLTPVAYSSGEIARKFPDWMWLYQLNPKYWVIEGFSAGACSAPAPHHNGTCSCRSC
jgi:lipopolysaccharide transport system permease protein